MKMNKQYILIALFGLMIPYSCLGELVAPKVRSKFFEVLENNPLVVVNFVDYDSSKDKPLAVENMQDAFNKVGNKPIFQSMVAFTGVNLRKIPSLRDNIPGLKDIMTPDTQTAIVLFKHGKIVQDKDGKLAFKTGSIKKSELSDFILSHFGEDLESAWRGYQQGQQASRQTITRTYSEPTYYYEPSSYYYEPRYYRPYRYGWGPGIGFGIGTGWGGGGLGFGFGW